MKGKVYLVGAGPGDPELLTVKAQRLLAEAEVVLYDRLVSAEVLALANPEALLLFAGKHEGEQERVQEWIDRTLLEYARAGRTVIRLKGGDPCVFGRGGEEWLALAQAGIEVEAVPGISSAVGLPELAGMPLTCRGIASGFAVVTGHAPLDWERYARIDTLVVLMGVKNRREIAASLIEAGRDPREAAAFIENGSTPRERVVVAELGEVARGEVDVSNPAVFIIGQVVRLRELLAAASSVTVCL